MIYCNLIQYTGTKKIPIRKILPRTCKQLVTRKREKFKEKLSVFLPMYGKDMLNEFYRFWTELNPSQTKMRFELEKTWQLDLRLSRWQRSQKKDDGKRGGPTANYITN